jgi:Copper amine oxidase N-terminal domain.
VKKIVLFCAILAMILGFSGYTPQTSAATAEKVPVHLKIGKFYILYTQYGAPFSDSQNRLLIPLRTIEGLMGGKVNYVNRTKTATVDWLDHRFELTIGSNRATIDGEAVTMDTVPVLRNGAMFLPIRLFLKPTGIEYAWDQDNQLLRITDKRVLVGEPFALFDGADGNANSKDDHILIHSYELVRSKTGLMVTLHAKNLSDEAIPEGAADINPLAFFSDGSFSVDSYSRPSSPSFVEIPKNGSVTLTRAYTNNLEYLISVARNS